MDPRQTTTDEPPLPLQGPRGELLSLVRSLRGRLEELDASGAWGLPERVGQGAVHPGVDADPAPPLAAALEGVPPASRGGSPRTPSAPESRAVEPARLRAAHPAVPPPSPTDAALVAAPPVSAAPRLRLPLPLAASDRLRELANEARVCTRCSLHEGRTKSVFARGGGSSGVVFVGEGPGEEENRQGLPFVGPAGQLLDRMIAAMQLDRDDVYVCNIVKCRPPENRKPAPDEMASCMPYLAEQLTLLEPRVIVALGATAVQGLLGTTEGITRVRGQWQLWRGKVPVMPTFHPAYLLRTPQAKREVWKDLQEVLRHIAVDAPRAPSEDR